MLRGEQRRLAVLGVVGQVALGHAGPQPQGARVELHEARQVLVAFLAAEEVASRGGGVVRREFRAEFVGETEGFRWFSMVFRWFLMGFSGIFEGFRKVPKVFSGSKTLAGRLQSGASKTSLQKGPETGKSCREVMRKPRYRILQALYS